MLEKLEALLGYANRQVVLNVYQGDELLKRDGFSFDRIVLMRDRIVFIRDNRTVEELMLDDSPRFVRLSGFAHYYAIEQGGFRTELYFP